MLLFVYFLIIITCLSIIDIQTNQKHKITKDAWRSWYYRLSESQSIVYNAIQIWGNSLNYSFIYNYLYALLEYFTCNIEQIYKLNNQ